MKASHAEVLAGIFRPATLHHQHSAMMQQIHFLIFLCKFIKMHFLVAKYTYACLDGFKGNLQ